MHLKFEDVPGFYNISNLNHACDGASQRICKVQYEIPEALKLSPDCVDLLTRILVGKPEQRISIPAMCAHPWFKRNLPIDLQVK